MLIYEFEFMAYNDPSVLKAQKFDKCEKRDRFDEIIAKKKERSGQ